MKHFLKAIIAFSFLIFPFVASAGTEHNLTGWAWSSNIGWISFNSLNQVSPAVDYGVNLNANDTLTGYAWSPNVGWIKFGGLSNFPTGGGTQGINAILDGTNLKGWGRVCGGMNDSSVSPVNQTVPNNTCSGWTRNDGWDGWISLSGAQYSVDLTNHNFVGYAWGGEVLGWVLFNPQATGVCVSCGVTMNGIADLAVQSGGASIVNNNNVAYGTIPQFIWTLTSVPTGTSCNVSKTSIGGTAFATVTGITSNGSTTGSPLVDGTYEYKIECVLNGATTTSETVGFSVLPEPASFSLGPSETTKVQLLPSTRIADTEQVNVFVEKKGTFSTPVAVTISSVPGAVASTTFTYSFDGGQSYAPASGLYATLTSPFTQGLGFKVRITRLTGAPNLTGTYTVTLKGAASGFPDSTKNIIINPTAADPQFQEF